MTREILFRGKHLDNGEWAEGAYCPKSCDSPFGPMIDKPSIIKLDDPFSGFWFDVDPSTICQFVGLCDKNGKKIFEADIVRYGNKTGHINYGEGCFSVRQISPPHSLNNPAIDIVFNENPNDVEVIGNIHDNPELLEVEE